MPSSYLTTAEAPLYGLSAVSTSQIIQASALIDAYLKRPEGLVWAPDSTGNPCYMTSPVPTATFALTSPISPGANVPVQLSGPKQILQVGDVVILDQPTSNLVEACVIATTSNPPNPSPAITLQNVINSHGSSAPAVLGLTIEEQRYMPASRPITFLSRTPLMNVISGVGRYGYGRRGDHADYNMEQFNLLAAVSKFGGPPVWELFQQNYPTGWDVQTGQVWVPAGIMLAYYSEVKLRYVAGFAANAIPGPIKMAVVQLMAAMNANPGLGAVKSLKAGDTSVAMFAASVLSDDTKAAIEPYAARVYV
jgi:hypothetical protein